MEDKEIINLLKDISNELAELRDVVYSVCGDKNNNATEEYDYDIDEYSNYDD